jgi:hypothetical protein
MKLTDGLLAKMAKAFEGREGIFVNQGLSREELRCLERNGCVEKTPFFERSKYVDVPAQKRYLWRRKGAVNG